MYEVRYFEQDPKRNRLLYATESYEKAIDYYNVRVSLGSVVQLLKDGKRIKHNGNEDWITER